MYEIKVLSSQEFDSLPKEITRGSDISDSLGFADPKTGKAYVRHVAIPELQKYLINHELEELTTDDHHHEDENGIRHKKFFKDIILRPLMSAIGMIPGASTLMGMFGGGGGNNQVYSSQDQQQQYMQQMQNMSGSYVPQSSIFLSNGGYGSPLSLFSGSGSYTPNQVPGAASGLSDPGSGALSENVEEPEWMKQQKYGSENGRIMFK